MECFGPFSWPKFVELFPVYLGSIAALGAVYVAWKQLGLAARQAAERDALQNLDTIAYSSDWQSQRKVFLSLREQLRVGELTAESFAQKLLTRNQSDTFASEIQSFRIMMNHYEVIAIGIQSGAYSDDIYRKFLRGQFKKDWRAMFEVVQRMRELEDNQRIFIEAQKLAESWQIDF